ncbi:MAG: vWA domain-containing protein [Hyphomicrobium sp.]
MRRFVSKLAIVIAVLVAGRLAVGVDTTPAHAEDPATTMLLIDGSGSMWGRLEGEKRAKIDMVRDALRPLIATPGATRIGLASYGHRRKSDCRDVEVIAPPAADPALAVAQLDKLNPRGKGPLAIALKETAAAIGASRPASLVIINDGDDNCHEDACAAAADVAKTAPGLAVHVVSLGVDPADQPRISCIAKATGGRFIDVRDAAGVATAIADVAKLAMLAPSTPGAEAPQASVPVPAGATPTASKATLTARAALAAASAPLDAKLSWRVTNTNTDTLTHAGDGNAISLSLEPGTYELAVTSGSVRALQRVTLEAGKRSDIVIPLNAARVRVAVTFGKDAPASDNARLIVSKSGAPTAEWIGRATAAHVILPAGTYDLALRDGDVTETREVALSAGADIASEFNLSAGRLELQMAEAENGPPLDDVTFAISIDDPDSPEGRREVARSRARNPSLALPAGTYYVLARHGDVELRERIALGAGDVVSRTLVSGSGRLEIASTIGGRAPDGRARIALSLTPADPGARKISRVLTDAMALTLAPGRYTVSAALDEQGVSASEVVTVEAGKTAQTVLKLDAAEVTLKAGAGINPGDHFWQIRDAGGKAIWHGLADGARVFLKPGRYTARIESRDRSSEAAFEVRSGEQRTVQLDAG